MKITGRRQYCVFIMSDRNRTRYRTGVSTDWEDFKTAEQNSVTIISPDEDTGNLVYLELFEDVVAAVEREIAIRGYSFKKKQKLIATFQSEYIKRNGSWPMAVKPNFF